MGKRVAKAIRILLDLELAVYSFTTFPDDTFLVSYPKSGSTWLRFLIGNLTNPNPPVDFANLEERFPDIYRNRDRSIRRIRRPRYLKSHEPFTPTYRKVIYLVRDPRDVAISYYHHQLKFRQLTSNTSISEFINSFLEGEVDSYGSWSEHVGGWLGARHHDEMFLLVRYEDLHSDIAEVLKSIAAFLGVSRTREHLRLAKELSSFERMRRLEHEQFTKWKTFAGSQANKSFVRSGRVEGWREELSSNLTDRISATWSRTMTMLGYSVT